MIRESDLPPNITDLSVPCADYVTGYWDIAPRPTKSKPRKMSRIVAFLALLIIPGHALTMPFLLIIPFLAGAVVFVGLVVSSGWGLYIGP